MKPPKPRPCGSCPYRKDVPSGVWDPTEYAKLITFDRPTAEQPMSVFLCHQADGHLCAGWVGCHNMKQSLGIRIAASYGHLSPEEIEEILDYGSPVELWETGMDAAAHGMADVPQPSARAQTVMRNLRRKGLGDGTDPGQLRAGDDQRSSHADAPAE